MSGAEDLKKMLRAGVMRDSQEVNRVSLSFILTCQTHRPADAPAKFQHCKKNYEKIAKKRASEGHVLKEGEGKEEGGGGA